MLDSVLGFKVALGLPAKVTSPDLTGCTYCRWEPETRFRIQPSLSNRAITSLIFMGTKRP